MAAASGRTLTDEATDQLARLDVFERALETAHHGLAPRVHRGFYGKVAVEFGFQDGFVDSVRIVRDEQLVRIPRAAPAPY